MAEFITNPRRVPRAPARCRAAVASAAGSFEAETEDIGARGCQVVSPRGVKRGETVRITIANDKVLERLRVSGKVAWVSAQFPWRVGIAFDEEALPECARWFDQLVAAHPGMGALRKVPARIALDAMVYLGAPPRFLVDFTADEAVVLRAIASGARVDDLMARLRHRWPAMQCALFSLLARSAVTLSRGQAVHPDSWKRILDELEAALAVESLDSGAPALAAPPEPPPAPAATSALAASPPPGWPAPPPAARAGTLLGGSAPDASPWGTPPTDPGPYLDLEDAGPPLEVAAPPPPRGAARVTDGGAPWGAAHAHQPDFRGAGVGWRAAPRARSAEAQAVLDRARDEFRAGNLNGAIALLRRALALAPGDPEIAEVLGKFAFQDRTTDG
jgi:hypothetical protein